MFPWIDGFHWTATHIIFLSLFFSVCAGHPLHICLGHLASRSPISARTARPNCAGGRISRTCPKRSGTAATSLRDAWPRAPATMPSIAVSVRELHPICFLAGQRAHPKCRRQLLRQAALPSRPHMGPPRKGWHLFRWAR